MKHFKDILSEVSQPKSAEEKRFKDQHTIELIKHPVAPDSQFTGEIEGVTRKPRPADQEGDSNYDKAYSVKDKPFKMPRNVDENVEEAEESLDEAEMEMWSVDIPKQHNVDNKHSVKVKARNSREAIRKAATKIGMKDSWMSIKIGNVKRLGAVKEEAESLEEKAVSQAQQKLMGMALAYKRGEMDNASDEVKDLAKSMSMKDLEDFAKTKHDDLPKKVQKESLSFKDLIEKVTPETDLLENPQEEIPMMMRQLHFISYAADEIMEYLAIDGLDPEEWWQNKLAYAFAQMKSLHAYVEGDKHMMGVDDEDELEAGYMSAAYESVEEETDSQFKAGEIVLENDETIEISEEDAQILSSVFEALEEDTREEMYQLMYESREDFEEILNFARESVE